MATNQPTHTPGSEDDLFGDMAAQLEGVRPFHEFLQELEPAEPAADDDTQDLTEEAIEEADELTNSDSDTPKLTEDEAIADEREVNIVRAACERANHGALRADFLAFQIAQLEANKSKIADHHSKTLYKLIEEGLGWLNNMEACLKRVTGADETVDEEWLKNVSSAYQSAQQAYEKTVQEFEGIPGITANEGFTIPLDTDEKIKEKYAEIRARLDSMQTDLDQEIVDILNLLLLQTDKIIKDIPIFDAFIKASSSTDSCEEQKKLAIEKAENYLYAIEVCLNREEDTRKASWPTQAGTPTVQPNLPAQSLGNTPGGMQSIPSTGTPPAPVSSPISVRARQLQAVQVQAQIAQAQAAAGQPAMWAPQEDPSATANMVVNAARGNAIIATHSQLQRGGNIFSANTQMQNSPQVPPGGATAQPPAVGSVWNQRPATARPVQRTPRQSGGSAMPKPAHQVTQLVRARRTPRGTPGPMPRQIINHDTRMVAPPAPKKAQSTPTTINSTRRNVMLAATVATASALAGGTAYWALQKPDTEEATQTTYLQPLTADCKIARINQKKIEVTCPSIVVGKINTDVRNCTKTHQKKITCDLQMRVANTNLATKPFRATLPEVGRYDTRQMQQTTFHPQPSRNPQRVKKGR